MRTREHVMLLAAFGMATVVLNACDRQAPQSRDDVAAAGEERAAAPAMPEAANAPGVAADASGTPAADGTAGASSPAGEGVATLDNATALGALNAINRQEIDASRLALEQALDAPAKAYAQRMIDEHGENQRATERLGARDGSALQARLEEHSRATLERLRQARGDGFQQAYVQAMVQGHEQALQTLDNALIPAAQGEARAHLEATRGHVAEHLRLARELQGRDGGAQQARQAPM